MNPLPEEGAGKYQARSSLQKTSVRVVIAIVAALSLFLLGRHFGHRSTDFIVYHQAAKVFLAGLARHTNIYAGAFLQSFAMEYVYPPLFLLLICPLGWLSFANAFGIWFAALCVGTGMLILWAYHEWRPAHTGKYWLIFITLAAVPLLYALRTGNAHLLVVLLTLAGVLAWSSKRIWAASVLLAFAGAIKVFPLFLLPFIVVRREWRLAVRLIALSCILWALPITYFGPRQTLALYRNWYDSVVRDVESFERFHQLDYSLAGTTRRWLSHVDYLQFRDRGYPQVNWLDLPPTVVRCVAGISQGLVLGVSLLLVALWKWPRSNEYGDNDSSCQLVIAATASVCTAAQLLIGPYTIFLYLSAWVILALTLPVFVEHCAPRLNNWLLAIGAANLFILAIPGRANRRALEAYGAFTLLGIGLWLICIIAGWKLLQTTRFKKD